MDQPCRRQGQDDGARAAADSFGLPRPRPFGGDHQLLHLLQPQRLGSELRGSVQPGALVLQPEVHGAQDGAHRGVPGQLLHQADRHQCGHERADGDPRLRAQDHGLPVRLVPVPGQPHERLHPDLRLRRLQRGAPVPRPRAAASRRRGAGDPRHLRLAGPHHLRLAGPHHLRLAGPHHLRLAGPHHLRLAGPHQLRLAGPNHLRLAGHTWTSPVRNAFSLISNRRECSSHKVLAVLEVVDRVVVKDSFLPYWTWYRTRGIRLQILYHIAKMFLEAPTPFLRFWGHIKTVFGHWP